VSEERSQQGVSTVPSLRRIYWSIEINLVLWLVVMGNGLAKRSTDYWPDVLEVDSTVVLVGLGLSAVLQHWAYYGLRRDFSRQSEPQSPDVNRLT
jgi:hypothetical protein